MQSIETRFIAKMSPKNESLSMFVELVVAPRSAKSDFAQTALIARFHLASFRRSSTGFATLNTFPFSSTYMDRNVGILGDEMLLRLLRPRFSLPLRKIIDELLREVNPEVYHRSLSLTTISTIH